MNSKILLAFLTGAALASGIVYLAVRNDPAPAVARASSPAPISVPARSPEVPPEPKRTPEVHPVPVNSVQPLRHVRREKPSAMPPSRWQMAQVQAPPPPVYHPPAVVVEKPAAPVVAPVPASTHPPAEPRTVALDPAPPPPEARETHSVIIRPGTVLSVRLGETLAGDRNQPGDAFPATLDQPLVADGWVIAERGARIEGKVVDVDRSYLRIELVKVTTSDNQRVQIRTEPYEKQRGSSTGRQAATVGVGSGDVMLSNRPVQIPVEARVTFKVQEPVMITERLN